MQAVIISLNLKIAKGGDDFSWRSRNLYVVKGIGRYNVLQNQPREEAPDATQITIDSMSGNALILDVVEAMTREASFLLQIENEGSDLTAADLSYVRTYSSRAEKVVKIIYTVGDNSYGIVAFAFTSGAEPVTSG